jgi:hypothetical protein
MLLLPMHADGYKMKYTCAKRGEEEKKEKKWFLSDTMACLHAFECKCNGKWHIFKSALVFSFDKHAFQKKSTCIWTKSIFMRYENQVPVAAAASRRDL